MEWPAAKILQQQYNYVLSGGAVVFPDPWNISELVLIPKPFKPMKSPADLRPIALLPPEIKVLSTLLAERIRPYALQFLADIPQFAYIAGRSLQEALHRVIARCAQVRALVASQAINIHGRRAGKSSQPLCGGMQLSLDISKAYDRLPRRDLEASLRAAEVPEELVQTVMALRNQAALHIAFRGSTGFVHTKRGIHQGSGLSPLLWSIHSGWVLRKLEVGKSLAETNTTYADDFIFNWVIDGLPAADKAYQEIRSTLLTLHEHGLQVSGDKTVILLELRGKHSKKALKKYIVKTSRGRCLRFCYADQRVDLKIVQSHIYLGVCISYKKFEQESVTHRMKIAKSSFGRLRSVLTCRAVPITKRLELWRSCVVSTMMHGLDVMVLSAAQAGRLRSLATQQARQIAKSYSVVTRESNDEFMERFALKDVIDMIAAAFVRFSERDRPEFERLPELERCRQWREILRANFVDIAPGAMGVRTGPGGHKAPPPVKLVPVDLVAEQFLCNECGFAFATQAALRSHQYKMHYEEDKKAQRKEEIQQQQQQSASDHSLDGMPACRHCLHQFF